MGFALLRSVIGPELAPLSQPIRWITSTNHALVARGFPRFSQFGWFYLGHSVGLVML